MARKGKKETRSSCTERDGARTGRTLKSVIARFVYGQCLLFRPLLLSHGLDKSRSTHQTHTIPAREHSVIHVHATLDHRLP